MPPVKSDSFTRAEVTQARACLMPKSLPSIAKYKMRGSLRDEGDIAVDGDEEDDGDEDEEEDDDDSLPAIPGTLRACLTRSSSHTVVSRSIILSKTFVRVLDPVCRAGSHTRLKIM
jgi:hypothetical protein